jgi:hypothetical protein
MTPLRRRLIEDFQIRHFAPGTQKNYLHCISRFAQHFGRSLGTEGKAASKCGTGRSVESSLK